MAGSPVVEALTSTADVRDVLVGKLLPALEGIPTETAIAAMLSCVILCMKEDVSEEELVEGVLGASGWIVTFLADIEDTAGKAN